MLEQKQHSLRVTLNVTVTTWGDVVEKAVKRSLSQALSDDVEYRRSIPLDFTSHLGLAHAEKESDAKGRYQKRIRSLIKKLATEYLDDDGVGDEVATEHLHGSVPPVLTPDEVAVSSKSRPRSAGSLDLDNEIKLVRPGCARLVLDEEPGYLCLVYSVDNARSYKGNEQQSILFPETDGPCLEQILALKPDEWLDISLFAVEGGPEAKLSIAQSLFDVGVVLAKVSEYDDDSD
jgi:lysine-specific demethylase/histidyl-hydroxylase NO66